MLYTHATMMGLARWKLGLGVVLLLLAAAIYALQIVIFDDAHTTLFYLVQDLAFLPVSILVVAIIVSEVMERRERVARIHKLNMVVGAFFSDLGNDLLRRLTAFDTCLTELNGVALAEEGWRRAEFAAARRTLTAHQCRCAAELGDLPELAALLYAHRPLLLALIENPSLLEHEAFSELLWAVLHVSDELDAREDLGDLPGADLHHLSGDITRAYRLLGLQWLDYMERLSSQYPYLYSLAVRTSPFGPPGTAVVHE